MAWSVTRVGCSAATGWTFHACVGRSGGGGGEGIGDSDKAAALAGPPACVDAFDT